MTVVAPPSTILVLIQIQNTAVLPAFLLLVSTTTSSDVSISDMEKETGANVENNDEANIETRHVTVTNLPLYKLVGDNMTKL